MPKDANYFKDYSSFSNKAQYSYFQQTRDWARVLESLKKDKFFFLAARSKNRIIGALPLFLYKSKYGNIINSVPYPGPLGGIIVNTNSEKVKEKIYRELFSKLNDFAHRNNVVLVTLISSPFWPDEKFYRKYFGPTYESENYTLYVDLSKPTVTTSHFRNNLKRMLKKASENNLAIFESAAREDILAWHKIHKRRHSRLGLETIPLKIFTSSVKYMVPAGKGKFFFVQKEGKIVAGCFVAFHNQVLDTYMISGDKEAYENGAIYLLINHLLVWAKEAGFKYFNWQSSKPRGGGPYNFKMQWGSKELPYFFFTKTYGKIDKIVNLGLEKVKKIYKWHYVIPYNIIQENAPRNFQRKTGNTTLKSRD